MSVTFANVSPTFRPIMEKKQKEEKRQKPSEEQKPINEGYKYPKTEEPPPKTSQPNTGDKFKRKDNSK